MTKKMTPKSVEQAKPGTARREIPDPACPGLYLIVQPTGGKGWALRYRFGNRPRKMTLGRWPLLGLADARKAASEAADKVERGIDPAAEAMAAKAESGVEDRDLFPAVLDLFLRRHASHNRSRDAVAAMIRREVLHKDRANWTDKPISEIARRDVIAVLDKIVDRGSPVTANRLRAHLNTLFRWAKGRDMIEANPLDGTRPPAPERPRDRVLTELEISLLWRASGEIGFPFGPLYRLLLLTGQRLREVAEMTRREVAGGEWTIPGARTKNGDQHVVPLSPDALAILEAMPRIGAQLIFTTNGDAPVSGFTRAKDRLDAAIAKIVEAEGLDPVPAFTIHDLRRTAATGMAGLGFPPHIVEAVINHRSGTRRGVAGVYNRFDYADEKRRALEAWARRVAEIVAGREQAGNVIRLGAAR